MFPFHTLYSNYFKQHKHMQEYLPKITVVTPSYNQAQFLEQTILSVIGQGYPNLEYIIMDGGSSDNSVAVIKRYETHIDYWQSEKDNGQGAAINAGFAKATGDVICWLNSDDLFMPGTLLKIGRMFKEIKEPTIIFGNCLHFYENNEKTRGSDVEKNYRELKLELTDYIIQPSSFWSKQTWEIVGDIDEHYTYVFDWEWFIRAKQKGVKFHPISDYLSLYRIHDAHKSGTGGNKRDREIENIYKQYSNEKISLAYKKWYTYTDKSKLFHKIIYAANHHNISILKRLIHLFFFSSISYDEYTNITPR